MQDKFYRLIANLIELTDEFEQRFARIENALGIKPEPISKMELQKIKNRKSLS